MPSLPCRSRRAVLVLAAALVPATTILACSDDNGPIDPPPSDITGTYNLVTVNGTAFPVVIDEDEETTTQLVAGTLVLNQGTACSGVLSVQVIDDGTEEVVDEFELGGACTYSVSGSDITLNFEDDDEPTPGTISGNTITLTITGENIVLVFQRV